jgi:hypothetical protein
LNCNFWMKFYLLYLWTKINFVEKLFGQKIDPRRYKFSSGHFITDMYLCIPIIYVCSQCLCVSYNLGAKIDAWVQKFLRKKTILAVFSGSENWCLGTKVFEKKSNLSCVFWVGKLMPGCNKLWRNKPNFDAFFWVRKLMPGYKKCV